MKKMVKAALAAALVCFSSSLFAAAPISFLKGTTYELFEDETVDNLAWGVEDADGLVLGGINSGIDLGIGAYIGDLWWSIYDVANIDNTMTTKQLVNNDSVAKDGINTDYVDVTKKTSKTVDNNIWNRLYLSFAGDDWGVQTYWYYSDYAAGSIGKQSEEDETHSTGYKWSKNDKYSRYNGTNTFGANFKGIGASDLNDAGLYLQLNNFQVAWNNNSEKHEYKNSWKQNGVSYSANGTTDSYSSKMNRNILTPYFQAEMGFDLPDFGALSTKFVLVEDMSLSFGFAKNTEVTTDITETNFSKTTTKTTTTTKYNKYVYGGTYADNFRFSINNTLTPKLVFDFDVGERVNIKALAAVGINTYTTPGLKNNVTTTVTETTTYDKVTKLTSKSYSKTVDDGTAAYKLSDSFTTKLSFGTAIAAVYQIKPDKFNLNFGFAWNAGSLAWTTTTKKNVTTKKTEYETRTNEAGQKTVTKDTATYYRADTAEDDATPVDDDKESKTTVYTADFTENPTVSIGSSWFLNDKVQLDMAYSTAFNVKDIRVLSDDSTGSDGLLDSQFKIQLSVKF